MSIINTLVESVRESFLRNNADLLALTKNGVDDVMRRVAAALSLDEQSQSDVMIYTDTAVLEQRGYAGKVARDDFKQELYKGTCRAFLQVQHNYVIEFVARLTPEAQEQLENIEITAGQRAPRPVEPPPPPPKSAQEQLEEQVIADYNGALSTDKMRAKMNSNVAYRDTFNRLSESGKLESRVTTYTDGRNL
jgi:hypothetical protein